MIQAAWVARTVVAVLALTADTGWEHPQADPRPRPLAEAVSPPVDLAAGAHRMDALANARHRTVAPPHAVRNPFTFASGPAPSRQVRRNPTVARPVEISSVTVPDCALTLGGIAESVDGSLRSRTALLIDAPDRVIYVSAGETIDDHFTVLEIQATSVVLNDVRHGGRVTLAMH